MMSEKRQEKLSKLFEIHSQVLDSVVCRSQVSTQMGCSHITHHYHSLDIPYTIMHLPT